MWTALSKIFRTPVESVFDQFNFWRFPSGDIQPLMHWESQEGCCLPVPVYQDCLMPSCVSPLIRWFCQYCDNVKITTAATCNVAMLGSVWKFGRLVLWTSSQYHSVSHPNCQHCDMHSTPGSKWRKRWNRRWIFMFWSMMVKLWSWSLVLICMIITDFDKNCAAELSTRQCTGSWRPKKRIASSQLSKYKDSLRLFRAYTANPHENITPKTSC